MNVCTSQVPSKVKFSNQQSVLATLFKHGFPISKHVHACRHVKIGPVFTSRLVLLFGYFVILNGFMFITFYFLFTFLSVIFIELF